MKAMILAAGKGERMRPLTNITPKPLLTVADKPLIMWHLDNLSQAGFKQVIINNAWIGYKIVEEIGIEYNGMQIIHSSEPECLETAGGIAFALEYLNENNYPFVVINGDTFIPQLPAQEFIQIAKNFDDNQHGFIYLVDNPSHNPHGDFILNINNNHLYTKTKTDLIYNKSSNLESLTFSGMALYRPNMFIDIVKGNHAKLAPLLNKGIDNNTIYGKKFIKTWLDIGTPQRLEHVNHIVENGLHLV
jgi:MurNAc alpha-1-phosphate uridylyltransferase